MFDTVKRRIIIIIFWGEKEKMNIGYVIYIYIYKVLKLEML